jgi:hypothetical protein
MKRKHFNDLSLTDKTLLIDDLAVEVSSIEYYDHRVHLYALNSLFIEAYHNLNTGEVERITVAEYGDLDKYLSRIMLYKLVSKKGSYPGAL